MVKYLLLSISLFTARGSFSQIPLLQKLWVSGSVYMQADPKVIRFETLHPDIGNHRQAKEYFFKGDTLRLHDNKENFDFLIDTSAKDRLTLTPVGSNSILLTQYITFNNPKREFAFRERNLAYTDTIKFEKLLFRSTNCYGFCPAMTIEIDNKKHLKFIGEKHAVKQGYFTSTISDKLFAELIQILSISELDKLKCNTQTNVDAPTYTLEIHYNNKVRYFRSAVIPFITDDLLAYLMTLPAKISLTTSKNFDIKLIND